jgi:uncharacterized coiled-coil DUF342 family protein
MSDDEPNWADPTAVRAYASWAQGRIVDLEAELDRPHLSCDAEIARLTAEVEELKREQARLHGEIMALEDEVQFHQVGDGYEAGRAHSEQAHMAKIESLRSEVEELKRERDALLDLNSCLIAERDEAWQKIADDADMAGAGCGKCRSLRAEVEELKRKLSEK